MKKFRFLSLLLCFGILFSAAPISAHAVEDPYLKSTDECLLIDISTGRVLYSITPDQNHSIASLTKIMTCLLAVEAIERGDVGEDDLVTAGAHVRYGLDTSSSNADIVEGETFRFKDLIYLALVHSANDACNVIGEHLGGSIQGFVTMMNSRAKELGCTNSQFNDTCGMLNRSDGHYSCANDLYLITMEALKHSLFYTVCTTVDYTVPATNKHDEREIHNSNALISENGLYGSGYLYEGVAGVKTGFTKPAGYCLVSTCEKNGLHLMCIVLGCNGPLTYTSVPGEYQNFMDSATLYDWAYNNFAYKTIFLAGERLKRMDVQNAKDEETVAIAPDENLDLLLAKDINDNQIHVDVDVDESSLVAPIQEGDVLGKINVYVSDELYYTCNAVAATSVELEKSAAIKESISNFFSSTAFKVVIFSILGIALLLGVAYFLYKTKKRQDLERKLRAQERKRANARQGRSVSRSAQTSRQRRQVVSYDEEEYPDEYEEESDDGWYRGDRSAYQEAQPPRQARTDSTSRRPNTGGTPRNYPAPRGYASSQVPDKPAADPAESSQKWEEADLDDILRSLGIDPDEHK